MWSSLISLGMAELDISLKGPGHIRQTLEKSNWVAWIPLSQEEGPELWVSASGPPVFVPSIPVIHWLLLGILTIWSHLSKSEDSQNIPGSCAKEPLWVGAGRVGEKEWEYPLKGLDRLSTILLCGKHEHTQDSTSLCWLRLNQVHKHYIYVPRV